MYLLGDLGNKKINKSTIGISDVFVKLICIHINKKINSDEQISLPTIKMKQYRQ